MSRMARFFGSWENLIAVCVFAVVFVVIAAALTFGLSFKEIVFLGAVLILGTVAMAWIMKVFREFGSAAVAFLIGVGVFLYIVIASLADFLTR